MFGFWVEDVLDVCAQTEVEYWAAGSFGLPLLFEHGVDLFAGKIDHCVSVTEWLNGVGFAYGEQAVFVLRVIGSVCFVDEIGTNTTRIHDAEGWLGVHSLAVLVECFSNEVVCWGFGSTVFVFSGGCTLGVAAQVADWCRSEFLCLGGSFIVESLDCLILVWMFRIEYGVHHLWILFIWDLLGWFRNVDDIAR
ncbi:Uncharacterised protein [Arcanobacterium haemolyticum]|nr:Uncharacterised protein [Arcanobacterium haemolyticum]